ncbi:MerR family transcriptional regulator [Aliiroseovarius sp.]|uniref:MerR family transcriptional regulator n=1 Tax=Aliiroseovarius sp. TaxID=1872442 RepID=UPI003BAC2650
MDKKSPDAFRTISEVAEWLGVPTHVLRFWESRFAQVKPVKRAGGRRYYRPADMELLGGIRKLLHDDGMTIRGVQKLLREEGVKHVAAMSPALDDSSMIDVTPSNVVELRSQPAAATTPPASAKTTVVEEAVEVAVDDPAPVPAEPAADPKDPIPVPPAPAKPISAPPTASEPVSEPVTEPPLTTWPEPTPEPEVPPLARPAAQANPEAQPAPMTDAEPEVATGGDALMPPATDTPSASPMQTGFDFGESAATDDLAQEDVVESPEAVEFHAHGADFTPPPVEEAQSVDQFEDPSELPRLGAQDLPLATGDLGKADAAPAADPVPAEITVPPSEDPATAPSRVAVDVAIEVAVELDPPAGILEGVTATEAAGPPETEIESEQVPTADEGLPASEPALDPAQALPEETLGAAVEEAEEPSTAESTIEAAPIEPEVEPPVEPLPPAEDPATVAEDMADASADASPAPEPEPVLEDPVPETTSAPAPMDISHIPNDPEEDDISPAGPSLAARMRRLTARTPQGSPAQMRALGDRLQELSGRMKRDAPRRGMQ